MDKNIILFTDTDCDVTKEQCEEYGFKFISMPYIIGDKEIKPYISFEKFNEHEYYDALRNGAMPKTCALSPIDYTSYFEPYFKEGKDILYVHFSKAMSGSFNAMNIAYEDLKEKYPERKLYTIDTRGITLNAYAIVREIMKLVKNNVSLEEVVEWANKEIDHWATYLFVNDLSFFKRSGRVKALSAFMGNIIGIKPIIFFDNDGMMGPKSKARGTIGAIDKIIDYMKELGDDIAHHTIYIGHSDNLKLAEQLANKIKDEFGSNLDIEYAVVNPTAGAHCGPDGIGVSFHAIHR